MGNDKIAALSHTVLFGSLAEEELRALEGISFELLMTNAQVAARIGTVREVVSRALSRLQTDGLISMENRRVMIINEKAMNTCTF